MHKACFAAVLAFFCTASAQAGLKNTFQIDERVNLEILRSRPNQVPSILSGRSKDIIFSDASAVLIVNYAKLKEASVDFNRYTQIGMPSYLIASRIVDSPSPDILTTWNWMRTQIAKIFTQESKHCFEVRIYPQMGKGASGTYWTQQACPRSPKNLPASLKRHYEDAPAFSELTGTWYMEPLSRKENGQTEVYVRYTLYGKPDTIIPLNLVEAVIQSQFGSGIRQVIQALANTARSR